MAKLIPWQDLVKILAKIVPRACQDLTKKSTEGQPGVNNIKPGFLKKHGLFKFQLQRLLASKILSY